MKNFILCQFATLTPKQQYRSVCTTDITHLITCLLGDTNEVPFTPFPVLATAFGRGEKAKALTGEEAAAMARRANLLNDMVVVVLQ